MSTKEKSAISKIHTAEMHWHNTVGEYLLRYGGIFLALSILVIGLKYGYDSALFTSNHGAGYAIKHGSERTGKTVLFVTLNFNESYSNEANILKEAIASYHGVKILNLQGSYKLQNMEKENQIVFVMGSREIDNVPGLLNRNKIENEKVIGVGITLSGSVSPDGCISLSSPLGWKNVHLKDPLQPFSIRFLL